MMNIKKDKEGSSCTLNEAVFWHFPGRPEETNKSQLDNQCSGQHLNGAFSIHKPSASCYMTLLRDKCRWSEVECTSVITSEVYNEISVIIRV